MRDRLEELLAGSGLVLIAIIFILIFAGVGFSHWFKKNVFERMQKK